MGKGDLYFMIVMFSSYLCRVDEHDDSKLMCGFGHGTLKLVMFRDFG